MLSTLAQRLSVEGWWQPQTRRAANLPSNLSHKTKGVQSKWFRALKVAPSLEECLGPETAGQPQAVTQASAQSILQQMSQHTESHLAIKCRGARVGGATASGPADVAALESHLALKSVWGMSRRGNRKRPAALTTAVLGADVWRKITWRQPHPREGSQPTLKTSFHASFHAVEQNA